MNRIYKIFGLSAAVLTVGSIMQSCQSEAPFTDEGYSNVRLNVAVSSRLTRAIESLEELQSSARIYVSDKNGVLNKWVGIQNIPRDGFALKYGEYLAEAFAGDSVAASFDKRYFKGSTPFVVDGTSAATQVSVTCKIANVVVSIDDTTVKPDLIQDFKVEISSADGTLTFTDENLLDYGYFMMSEGDSSLDYVISGVNTKGNSFTKKGVISNVKPAYNYRLRFSYNPTEGDDGGAFLTITVVPENLIEDDVIIFGKPVFSWVGGDPKVDEQIIGEPGSFTSKNLRIAAHLGFSSLEISTKDASLISKLGESSIELVSLPERVVAQLEAIGLKLNDPEPKEDLNRYFIEFGESFLNSLEARDTEYVITIKAVDLNGKSASYDVRIANSPAAIAYSDPIIVDTESFNSDMTAISANSANIPVNVTKEDVVNPTLQYRKVGSTSWESKSISLTRAAKTVVVSITGLEEGMEYEYRVVGGQITNGVYEFESTINTFRTEEKFVIPNSSFEEWSTYSASTLLGTKTVDLPGPTKDKLTSFWGSGNEGAATANKTLTKKSEDMKHSGSYSARLGSDAAMGIIAAGNIFTGYYVKTDGTNGVLSVGKEYNGSHPKSLKVWANYRPGGNVSVKSDNEKLVEVVKGGTDQGQIYVALTTEPVEIRTNPKNLKLFDKDAAYVMAYGQVTWKEAFGPDNQLQEIEIPLEYTKAAKTTKPTHLVIVCSASKFGDYFCGSSSSVMYLDDFELVY